MRVDQGVQITYQSLLAPKGAADDGDVTWSFEPFDEDDGSEPPVQPASDSASVDTTSISAGYWYLFDTSAKTQAEAGKGDSEKPAITAVETTVSDSQSVLDEFEKWAKMTPAERIRAQILEARGLTEQQFQSSPPEVREAISKEIAEEIKRQLGSADGAEAA